MIGNQLKALTILGVFKDISYECTCAVIDLINRNPNLAWVGFSKSSQYMWLLETSLQKRFVDAVLALPKLKQADFTALSLDLSKFKQLRVIVCELESIDQVKTLYNLRGLDIKHIKTMPNEFQCLDVINNLERLQWMRIDGKSLSTNVMEVLGRRWGKARKIEKIKKILLCIKGNKDVLREIIKEL
jgi:hypothetical protein